MARMPIDEEHARQVIEEIGLRSFVVVGRDGDGAVKYLTSHSDHIELLGLVEFAKFEIAKAGGI